MWRSAPSWKPKNFSGEVTVDWASRVVKPDVVRRATRTKAKQAERMERIDGRTSGIGESFDVQIQCGYGRGTLKGADGEEIVKEMSAYTGIAPSYVHFPANAQLYGLRGKSKCSTNESPER